MGFDILIEKNISIDDIKSALSKSFDLPLDTFFMVEGFIGDYIDENGVLSIDYSEDDSRHLCQVYKLKGEFKTKIELGMRNSFKKHTLVSLSKNMSKILKCSCLFGSEDLNPYHWILVDDTGNTKLVNIDSERLDNHNEFVILRGQ